MFKISSGKGFHITFENGVTVSVQFGYGNYCENRDHPDGFGLKNAESNDAEVAVWTKSKRWILQEYDEDLSDNVGGYFSSDKVLDIMNWAAKHNGE